MKHTTIRIFCLALCAALALSGCSKTGGEGGSQTAEENSAVTTAEQAEETGETSVSETEVSDVTEKNETTTVSGTDVSDDAKVSGTVTGTAKVSETAKAAETTRVPGPPDVTAAPASPPPEGNKPDTYADPSEYGYSDTELCDLALRYYGSRTNYKPDHAEVDSTDGNTVNIHLYDDSETHTSTVNWYYVDRNTGKGTDISGNEVDLTAPAAELWNPSVPQRGQTETGKWCSVLFIGYINTDIESFIAQNVAYREFTLQNQDYTWLADMPKMNYAETPDGHELYLIIPSDDEASVEVAPCNDDEMNVTGHIYNSYRGGPFLLRCNVSEIRPDVMITVTDNSGRHQGFPLGISGKDGTLVESDCYTRLMDGKSVW